MDVRELVAWNLRRLRVERSISQDDLAHSAGVERAYVGHIERGSRNPTVTTLERLAIALNAHVSELLREPEQGTERPSALKPGRRKKS